MSTTIGTRGAVVKVNVLSDFSHILNA